MSIVTKTGDAGSTGLMFNRRLSKAHPRVEAYGCVDELTACLGLARATGLDQASQERLLAVQKDLMVIMSELATAAEDNERYVQAGFGRLHPEQTQKLDSWVSELEASRRMPRDWVIPGATPPSAALDFARAVCRRAERRVCALQDQGELRNQEVIVYLNRLSDLLWLLARSLEG